MYGKELPAWKRREPDQRPAMLLRPQYQKAPPGFLMVSFSMVPKMETSNYSRIKNLPESGTSWGNHPFFRANYVFFKSILLIRVVSVVGGIPNKTAAPSFPKIFQLVFFKARRIFSRSNRFISLKVRTFSEIFPC